MTSKQRISVIFSMLSLTVLMLCFQNCGQNQGTEDLGSGGFIINPPTIFASKLADCTAPSATFKTNEMIYMCIQNAGAAPTYCHTYAGSQTCNYELVSTGNGWTSGSTGWVKGYSANMVFGLGSFVSYVIHTNDQTSIGQANFNVTN